MDKSAKIYVAGHAGLIGTAVTENLKKSGYTNLLLRTHAELDLLDTAAVKSFFETEKPEYVVDIAAKVGGIQANIDYPAEYFYENMQIQNNLMWSAKIAQVKRFLFVGSAVVYPNDSPQPMKEEYFMRGEPDVTKSGYAHAKIGGVKFGLSFNTCLPTNIYGVNDNFNPETAHVIPALLMRMHDAKVNNADEVVIWGKGNARREFLYVDDLAEAIVWLLGNYTEKQFVNVGTGEDVSMRELAEEIKDLVGFEGKLVFDATKPEGIPRRLFDVSRIHNAGWRHKVELHEGLERTYAYYLENVAK